MSRLVIHGLDRETITQLRQRHDIVWIADDPRADVAYLDIRDRCATLVAPVRYQSLPPVLSFVASKAHEIYECYSRHHYLRSINGRSAQDYSYLMATHVEWAYELLTRHKPDVVLFANIPHEGYDNVLHEVARFLGIRTVMFLQVPFSPRHWVLDGHKPVSESLAAALGPAGAERADELVQTFLEQLDGKGTYFYMKHIRPIAIPTVGEILASLLKGRFKQAVAGSLAAVQQSAYETRLHTLVAGSPPIQPGLAYGYFPLHLQPELTTSALGEALYFNQVVALRHFAEVCQQAGMSVVVKDNPKQNFSHRSAYFFDAVGGIKNAIFVSRGVPSHQLIQSARLVGTVTGTAGLEALRNGKPVICYGDAWWRRIPGVFAPSASPEQVMGCTIDPIAVAQAIRKIYGQSVQGCSDLDYVGAFRQDAVQNSQNMVTSVEALVAA